MRGCVERSPSCFYHSNVTVIPFSAETKQGREETYDLIDELLLQYKREHGEVEMETE